MVLKIERKKYSKFHFDTAMFSKIFQTGNYSKINKLKILSELFINDAFQRNSQMI